MWPLFGAERRLLPKEAQTIRGGELVENGQITKSGRFSDANFIKSSLYPSSSQGVYNDILWPLHYPDEWCIRHVLWSTIQRHILQEYQPLRL